MTVNGENRQEGERLVTPYKHFNKFIKLLFPANIFTQPPEAKGGPGILPWAGGVISSEVVTEVTTTVVITLRIIITVEVIRQATTQCHIVTRVTVTLSTALRVIVTTVTNPIKVIQIVIVS